MKDQTQINLYIHMFKVTSRELSVKIYIHGREKNKKVKKIKNKKIKR